MSGARAGGCRGGQGGAAHRGVVAQQIQHGAVRVPQEPHPWHHHRALTAVALIIVARRAQQRGLRRLALVQVLNVQRCRAVRRRLRCLHALLRQVQQVVDHHLQRRGVALRARMACRRNRASDKREPRRRTCSAMLRYWCRPSRVSPLRRSSTHSSMYRFTIFSCVGDQWRLRRSDSTLCSTSSAVCLFPTPYSSADAASEGAGAASGASEGCTDHWRAAAHSQPFGRTATWPWRVAGRGVDLAGCAAASGPPHVAKEFHGGTVRKKRFYFVTAKLRRQHRGALCHCLTH